MWTTNWNAGDDRHFQVQAETHVPFKLHKHNLTSDSLLLKKGKIKQHNQSVKFSAGNFSVN